MMYDPGDKALFTDILKRYNENAATPEEIRFVNIYLETMDLQPDAIDLMSSEEKKALRNELAGKIHAGMQKEPASVKNLHHFTWQKWIAAASVVILAGIGIRLLMQRDHEKSAIVQQENRKTPERPAFGKSAVLTLADGSSIMLDSAANGSIATQGSTHVTLLKSGQVAYQAPPGKRTAEFSAGFNTLTVPSGQTYMLLLPDGSKVWMNSASSLRFPTAFTGTERVVELQGEAYFEIAAYSRASVPGSASASGTHVPFRVALKRGAAVEVLGTSFNINAYDDETIVKATLLKGSVRVAKKNGNVIIKPGQQAQFDDNAPINVIKQVDMEEVMAWKNGEFYFKKASIDLLMRQVARWYDVEIEFRGEKPEVAFSGVVPRQESINKMLDVLRATQQMAFKLEGKKLIVSGAP